MPARNLNGRPDDSDQTCSSATRTLSIFPAECEEVLKGSIDKRNGLPQQPNGDFPLKINHSCAFQYSVENPMIDL
ncbi:hypothetical protein QE152_g26985 [Popillia japonica]|uniref:Uncharacterized protein n=1 Tax=Popillia japonica TaxID=7064 RepID=A0AAW1JWQ7_POPJA